MLDLNSISPRYWLHKKLRRKLERNRLIRKLAFRCLLIFTICLIWWLI